MTKHIYLYRMTSDSGCAPCVFTNNYKTSDLLTLACCKGGRINKGKEVFTGMRHTIGKKHMENIKNHTDEVYVVGIHENCYLYVAKITSIIEMKDYFSDKKYKNRMDCIYTVSGEKLKRNKNNPYFHPDNTNHQHDRDRLGQYVLLSDNKFIYLGESFLEHPVNENALSFIPKRQETKHYIEEDLGFTIIWEEISKIEHIHSKEPIVRIKTNTKECYQK